MRYVVGENEPGYLPESEVLGPYAWDEAIDRLVGAVTEWVNDLVSCADPDPTYEADLLERAKTRLWDALGFDMNEPTDYPAERPKGVEIMFAGRCFFIMPEAD